MDIKKFNQSYYGSMQLSFNYFCSGGRNRTGTVATGLLLELGHASNVEGAEQQVKAVRSIIAIKPELKQVLKNLYQ